MISKNKYNGSIIIVVRNMFLKSGKIIALPLRPLSPFERRSCLVRFVARQTGGYNWYIANGIGQGKKSKKKEIEIPDRGVAGTAAVLAMVTAYRDQTLAIAKVL